MNREFVQELLNSERPLPDGFQLETRAGLAQGVWYGLPKEEYVERMVEGKAVKDEKELIERVEMEYKGKHGVKEKVKEIARRKTEVVDEKLVWRREELRDWKGSRLN